MTPEQLEKRRSYERKYYLKNREAHLARSKARRKAMPEDYRTKGAAYRKRNLAKITAYTKKWAQDNRDKMRAYSRKTRFNLDHDRYLAFIVAQGCVCPGCGKEAPNNVDHDHACCPSKRACGACIRGILCWSCNVVLGLAQDNPEVLDALAAYLIRWKNKEVVP